MASEADKRWRKAHRAELKAYQEEYLRKNPDKILGYRLKRKFGITLDAYNRLLEAQDGKCAICGAKPKDRPHHRKLAVDHDHKTKKIRGLLCFHCNTGLGNLRDDPELLLKAVEYLKRV
jgi:hypothetical protein